MIYETISRMTFVRLERHKDSKRKLKCNLKSPQKAKINTFMPIFDRAGGDVLPLFRGVGVAPLASHLTLAIVAVGAEVARFGYSSGCITSCKNKCYDDNAPNDNILPHSATEIEVLNGIRHRRIPTQQPCYTLPNMLPTSNRSPSRWRLWWRCKEGRAG